ncbi:MAG: dienelactone hydrolase family protein [Rhodospirillaceae bacterium]|nr:dienelactone hydrolase family protein [Rhodospirillaceae bacterium]
MRSVFTLSGPAQLPAAGGRPRQLVVLLHGYGADGRDLLGLAPAWARSLPHAEFLAPDAPFPCEMAPYGRQWFGFEGRTAEEILAGARAAAAILDPFLDDALAARGLDETALALAGFSQGAMMALHVALRRARPVAAVAAFSGALIAPALLAAELRSRPPVLLVHGDADPVVPFAAMAATEEALRAAGVPVTAERRPGLAHAIDERGLRLAEALFKRAFGQAVAGPGATGP